MGMMSKTENLESTTDFNTRLRKRAQSVNYALQQLLAFQQIDSELKEALKTALDFEQKGHDIYEETASKTKNPIPALLNN